MNLTDKAKETARYLVEQWNNDNIPQKFVTFRTFGGLNISSNLGKIANDFVIPDENLFLEVSHTGLIEMRKKNNGNYEILLLQSLRDAVENNFGEGNQRETGLTNKGRIPLMRLSETHWNFLLVLAKAIQGGQLNKQNKNSGQYYLNIADNDGTAINKIDGFDDLFWKGHQATLSITIAQFFDLLSAGYFETARYEGNYYLNADKIIKDVDTYTSNISEDNTQARQFQCDIFMVMPFRDQLNSVYDNFIKPIGDELSIIIKRGDDRQNPGEAIMDKVRAYLENCLIVIVDCTEVAHETNGNVYYELGIADTLPDCEVIFISQTPPEKLPFDIRHRDIILYEDNSSGLPKLKADLIKTIRLIREE